MTNIGVVLVPNLRLITLYIGNDELKDSRGKFDLLPHGIESMDHCPSWIRGILSWDSTPLLVAMLI